MALAAGLVAGRACCACAAIESARCSIAMMPPLPSGGGMPGGSPSGDIMEGAMCIP